MKIEMVPSGAIEGIRDVVSRFLFKQIDEDGRFHFDDVMAALSSGNLNLWLAKDEYSTCAAIVTMFVDYPRRTDLLVIFMNGTRMAEWGDQFVQCLDDYAAANNCKYIQGGGRRGWARRLERYGYEHKYINVQKAVQ